MTFKRHELKIAKKLARKQITRATSKFVRACPDKVRLAANMVKGKSAETAIAMLRISPSQNCKRLLQVLMSAVQNAEKKNKDVDLLVVDKIFVDRGPMLKRMHPVSHGMAKPILKRMCHITVIVEEKL
ncbi:MAG: 50S ribosomal protein L22 [Deltaproteobacteria bacterium]|jgi:large subunit ribosomal protein L22|nr:50S ribosomal protein L22 [Deltaproteobacteria bacterium]